jgi:hypothetical protein
MLVQRYDSGRLSKLTRTGAGGARVPASIARTGIQVYQDAQGNTVREYRAPEVVFAAESLATLASVPVTIGHPGAVDSRNWRQHAVGHVSDAPPARRADGAVEWLDSAIVVQDADAIRRIEAGELVEVSMGYRVQVTPRAGVTPTGEHYDAVQEGPVVFNHLALLPAGKARAGSGARLRLDGNEAPDSQEEIMKVKVDGIEYDRGSDSHIQALERQLALATARADAAAAEAKANADALGKAQAKADAADAEVVKLKALDVDALVRDELAFRAHIAPALPKGYDFAGKTRDQVRADAVGAEVVSKAAKLPEAARPGYLEAHLELKLAAPAETKPTHLVKSDEDGKPPAQSKPKNPIAEAYAASWKVS